MARAVGNIKYCSRCATEKTLEEFGIDRYRADGRNVYCKACVRIGASDRNRKYRRENPAKVFLSSWCATNDTVYHRCLKKGLDYDLDQYREELTDRLQAMRCELTGIPLAFYEDTRWRAPSLDRIDPAKGYVYENVRIVAFGINALIGDWGEEKARELAEAFVKSNAGQRVEGV